MSTGTPPPPPPTSPLPPRTPPGLDWKTAATAVGLAVAVGVGYFLLFGGRSAEQPGANPADPPRPSVFGLGPPAAPPTAPPSAADAAAKRAAEEQAARDAQTRQQEAEAKRVALRARVATLKADGDEVRDALRAFDRLAATWKATYEPLRGDETGRRIAADPKQLVLVATAFGRERATPRQRQGWQERLDQLLAPVARFEGDPDTPVVVADDTLALMARLLTTVRAANQEWQADQAVLDAAKAATATSPPAAHTLTSGFEQRLAAERQEQLTQVEAARQAAVRKHTDELAAIEARKVEAETAAAKAEALVKLQEAEQKRKLAEHTQKVQAEIQAAALAKAQLLADFDKEFPTMKPYLQAFIATGYEGRGERGSTTKGGMSLKFLKSQGVLEEGRKGVEKMLTTARWKSDRGLGALPEYLPGDSFWKALDKTMPIKTQEFLVKYGEIMVEKGLLAP